MKGRLPPKRTATMLLPYNLLSYSLISFVVNILFFSTPSVNTLHITTPLMYDMQALLFLGSLDFNDSQLDFSLSESFMT
jgi:hypothetical protein